MKFSKFSKVIGSATLALGMTLGFSSAAQAGSEYIFFVGGTDAGAAADNSVQWQSSSALNSTSFTGTIYMTGGGLADVWVRQTGQPVDTNVAFTGWSGGVNGLGYQEGSYIEFNNGIVVGGAFSILDSEGNTFNANIHAGNNLTRSTAGFYFALSNVTFDIAFDGPSNFAGIDGLGGNHKAGSFSMIEFRPDEGTGSSAGAGRTEVSVVVPTPAAALAGLPMLGVLGLAYAIRRRRMMANA